MITATAYYTEAVTSIIAWVILLTFVWWVWGFLYAVYRGWNGDDGD